MPGVGANVHLPRVSSQSRLFGNKGDDEVKPAVCTYFLRENPEESQLNTVIDTYGSPYLQLTSLRSHNVSGAQTDREGEKERGREKGGKDGEQPHDCTKIVC